MRSRINDSPRVDSRFVSIRRAATNSRNASARFVRASALVDPSVFTPGISSTHATYPERTFLYTAVNICQHYTITHQNPPPQFLRLVSSKSAISAVMTATTTAHLISLFVMFGIRHETHLRS